MIGDRAPAAALQGMECYASSPDLVYQAASQSALRRALPGVETRLTQHDDGHLEIEAHLAEGLRACPQIFHFATGGARVLSRLIGLTDAAVSASIGDRKAIYLIAVFLEEPSREAQATLSNHFLCGVNPSFPRSTATRAPRQE
ncbi:MAG: hypothetical protein CL933_04125 [Deltaproteobacteria bacterium]|nr:hypothetical protein [Deltaproteobacteria bacterium]